ncbi:O-antigen polymerase [Clostridium tyrobutyricum]|uniref:O-antigen polymerase n=1 Tax=Clostridium tyrobutyricum TaxID=1519 RepID=UPI001C384398|nr:O-antigen polymerase [Clostridium tyrobutyricum]MBV4425512.1 oligosaccharide repeat unit polymerase [Clostridium tyrobutyricum]
MRYKDLLFCCLISICFLALFYVLNITNGFNSIGLIISSIIILYVIRNILFNKFIFNPIILYIIGFLVPLAISQLKLSYLDSNFSNQTWEIIIVSIIGFIMPTILNGMLNKYNKFEYKNIDIANTIKKYYKPLVVFTMINILFILTQWKMLGGVPLLVGETVVSHLDKIKLGGYIQNFMIVCSGLGILYTFLVDKKKPIILLSILLPYIYSILQMLRSIMFASIYYDVCFLYLVFLIKWRNTVKINRKIIKYCIVLLVCLIILMPIVGKIRTSNMGANYAGNKYFWSSTLKMKYNNETLAWIYSYYVMGFSNFNYFVNTYSGPKLYGYNTFLPIIGPLQLKSIWFVKPDSIIIPTLFGGAVGTYLRELYLDGNIIYIFIAVIIFSSIINYIYIKIFQTNFDIVWYILYVNISYGILYMFFNIGALTSPGIITSTIIICLVDRVIINRNKCVDSKI